MVDFFPVTYNVTVYNESAIIESVIVVNGTSYKVMGLMANTPYNIAVFAINTCCGDGPVTVIMTMTNMREPTLPPPTTTTANDTTTSPTSGNILLLSIHTWHTIYVYNIYTYI